MEGRATNQALVGLELSETKSGLRLELISVLMNCDPLLHVLELNLLRPRILGIPRNLVAQLGSQVLQLC
jgi:hypothetical protein